MKRVVVIAWAAVAFGTPITPLALAGAAVACAGSYAYSVAGKGPAVKANAASAGPGAE